MSPIWPAALTTSESRNSDKMDIFRLICFARFFSSDLLILSKLANDLDLFGSPLNTLIPCRNKFNCYPTEPSKVWLGFLTS